MVVHAQPVMALHDALHDDVEFSLLPPPPNPENYGINIQSQDVVLCLPWNSSDGETVVQSRLDDGSPFDLNNLELPNLDNPDRSPPVMVGGATEENPIIQSHPSLKRQDHPTPASDMTVLTAKRQFDGHSEGNVGGGRPNLHVDVNMQEGSEAPPTYLSSLPDTFDCGPVREPYGEQQARVDHALGELGGMVQHILGRLSELEYNFYESQQWYE